MKKQETDILAQEIREKKKVPKEVKEKMNQVVFKNVALGIMVVLFFIFVNLGYYNITKNVFIVDVKVFSMCLIVITIILFEKAYEKDSSELAVYGIEILIVALSTLFMQYVYFYQDDTFIKLYMLIPLIFALYYVIKSTILAAKIQDTYRKNISDVKEIVKEEKRTIIEETIEDKDNIQEKEAATPKTKKEKAIKQQPKQSKPSTKTPRTTKTKNTTAKTTKKTVSQKRENKTGEKKTTKKSTSRTGDKQK